MDEAPLLAISYWPNRTPLPWQIQTAEFENTATTKKMVDSVSVSVNDNSKLKETLVSEDSVPTDLTVSVSVPSQDQEISEISVTQDGEKQFQHEQYHQEIVKRLRSELQLQKILVSQKNGESEKILLNAKQEVELLKQHIQLSSRENEALKKENNTLSENILDLQTKNLRLVSENKVLDETSIKAKEDLNELEKKLTELTVKHQRTLDSIDQGEFTVEQFDRLKVNQNSLIIKCQSLGRENVSARKTAEKWKKKFNNLRNQYENRLQDEVGKLRQSLHKQIEMLRSSGTDVLESRLLQTEHRREKAVQEAIYWKNLTEKLRSKVRELESIEDKKRLQLEQMEVTKSELVQRLSSVSSTKARLEKELGETKRESQNNIDNLKKDIIAFERRSQEYEMRIENQMKSLREYEDAFLAIYGAEEECNRWPTLMKVQSQHAVRMTKRVTQLETENEILIKQQNLLASKLRHLETELESKEKIVSHIQGRAPETIGLFRDKDALLRELRSQLNHKDLQLMEYARQVERLKRTRKQLVSDLEEVLRDRTALEAVKEMLKQNE